VLREWIPKDKIAPLGKYDNFDSQMKMIGRTPAYRRSVRKAYDRAITVAQNIRLNESDYY